MRNSTGSHALRGDDERTFYERLKQSRSVPLAITGVILMCNLYALNILRGDTVTQSGESEVVVPDDKPVLVVTHECDEQCKAILASDTYTQPKADGGKIPGEMYFDKSGGGDKPVQVFISFIEGIRKEAE